MTNYTVRPAKGRIPWGVKSMPNRRQVIAGVMIHSTRSGAAGLYDDGPGTENWGASSANRAKDRNGNPLDYGSFWERLIFRDGTRILCTNPDIEYASWTAGYGDSGTWAAGMYYIQYEVSQSRIDQPFSAESIDSLAQAVAADSIKYGFPLTRIPFLTQTGTRPKGICTHEDSANGRKLGKTDPGPLFPWPTFLGKAHAYRAPKEDGMASKEYEDLKGLLDDMRQRQDMLIAATLGHRPGAGTEQWYHALAEEYAAGSNTLAMLRGTNAELKAVQARVKELEREHIHRFAPHRHEVGEAVPVEAE